MPSVKNQDKRDTMRIFEMFNENKTKKNSDLLLQKAGKTVVGGWFEFERGRELILSRFPAIRIVGSGRSKKQSRSMRRGLRVDTDFVEFRKL